MGNQLPTKEIVEHLLSCGKFSTLELLWVSGTNVQRQRGHVRNHMSELMQNKSIVREFSDVLKKSMYSAPKPLRPLNPRPSDREIIFKAKDRSELIDFIHSIYQKFGFLPDNVKDTEAYYYSKR